MSLSLRYTDQMGHTIALPQTPKRIVSLVPSQTELLYYLGTPPVGQTIFCVHPADSFKTAAKVGGTKKLNLEAIRRIKPDLIIGNKEENEAEQIRVLQQEFPVWMSDINTIAESYEMVQAVGDIVGKSNEASQLIDDIKAAFNRLITPYLSKPSVVYLIWNDPYFAVGSDTFIHDVLEKSGFENALANRQRYPEITAKEINAIAPDYVFLSSEPFPFKKQHQETLSQFCQHSKIVLVDGEMFSWYGNRLQHTPDYVNRLISDIRSHESKSR